MKNRTNKIGLITLSALGLLLVADAQPASAQGYAGRKLKHNELHKVKFYNAPRQVQILDERPIVRDFREAPSASPEMALPPGPQGGVGGYGGSGAGALADPGGSGSGNPIQIPAAPGQAPYRGHQPSSLPLAKSGFDRTPSNIPARGMGPRNALPSGQTTNRLMGKMMPPKKRQAYQLAPGKGLSSNKGHTRGRYTGPKAATYSGGYGSGSGSGYGGSATRTEGVVRGSLLKKTK